MARRRRVIGWPVRLALLVVIIVANVIGAGVAGNVGDVRRYEYAVIGDPVNEAARLTELSKSVLGGVLAAGCALRLAGEAERSRWRLDDETVLRGRGEPTRLALPVTGAALSPTTGATSA